jgi:phosphoribosylformylglycinamidine cyclo-ligase
MAQQSRPAKQEPAAEANPVPKAGLTYAQAGVDIDAGDAMVGLIARHMQRTYTPRVLGKHGAFAGMFRLDYNEQLFKRNYREPVLVACTDGVGTKVKLATQMAKLDTIGQDLVAMNVNDLVVQGAEPLLFLDYIGVHKLSPEQATELVKGVADGCELAGCALLGGETAEMPDVYAEGDFDLAGFAVGVVELKRIIDGSRIEPGDVILGLESNGVHSNGFSLVRKVLDHANLDVHAIYPELDERRPLGEVLLDPTRIYAKAITSTLRQYKRKRPIAAMAHITGGGLEGNLPRVLGDKHNAKIDTSAWRVPRLFRFLQDQGGIDEKEMWRVFNMGLGFAIIAKPHFADSLTQRLRRAGERVHILGQITKGSGKVTFK